MPLALRSILWPRPKVAAVLGILIPVVAGVALYRWYGAGKGIWSPARIPLIHHTSISVVPGIYLLGAMSPSAVYVIETSKGLVLVDSGLDSDANLLKWEMTKLGLDWKRVCAILLTHAHADHSGGAEWLRGSTGATVYAGAGDVGVIKAGAPRRAFFSTFYMPGHEPHPTTVDVALKGDERLAFGEVEIQALAMPGHTPGSMCYLLERTGLRALFAGDVIMMLRGDPQPRSELRKPLGTYSAYLSPRYRGDARDSLTSLRRLRAMPVPSLVLPGHPAADQAPQSPCLSQDRWEALLDQGIRAMETLLARYAADGADFLDGNPKEILPEMDYLGDFRGSAVYGLCASKRFFVVGAPAGTGFLEFLNERQKQLGRTPLSPTALLLTSFNESGTAAITELVEKCRTEIVVGAAGIEKIKESCPPGAVIVSADDLAAKGWFPGKAIPLEGPGIAPLVYLVPWSGKNVLFSGRIPAKVTQRSGERLISELSPSVDDVRSYFASLRRLQEIKPDVWLPATSTDDQNANLYDNDWERVIEDNLLVVKVIVSH